MPSDRFELCRFEDGAVLVDFRTGNYYRVFGEAADWSAHVPKTEPRKPRPVPPDRLSAAPYQLIDQGYAVLHASAVERDGVLAFCGATGSGKSTVARVLGRPISDDLVVLGPRGVLVDAEPQIRAWGEGTQDRLELREGRVAPLREVRFLGPRGALARRPLRPSEAFALLLENSFAERGQWRAIVEQSRVLAQSVPMLELTLPDGLDALDYRIGE